MTATSRRLTMTRRVSIGLPRHPLPGCSCGSGHACSTRRAPTKTILWIIISLLLHGSGCISPTTTWAGPLPAISLSSSATWSSRWSSSLHGSCSTRTKMVCSWLYGLPWPSMVEWSCILYHSYSRCSRSGCPPKMVASTHPKNPDGLTQ